MNGRRGVVLATVVLLLVAGTLATLAGLQLARSVRHGGDEAWDAVRVRRAVEAVAATRSDTVATAWLRLDSVLHVRTRGNALSPELALLHVEGRGRFAHWQAGRLLWRAVPEVRAAHVDAALTVGGRLGAAPSSVGWADDGACVSIPAAAPVHWSGDPIRVGPLHADALAARLPAWTPGDDTCTDGACGAGAGILPGPAEIRGGTHRGVLLVQGDLRIEGPAEWAGILLVEGALRVDGDVVLRGRFHAGGDVTLSGGGRIIGDPCVVGEIWAEGPADRLGWVGLDRRAWPLWGTETW